MTSYTKQQTTHLLTTKGIPYDLTQNINSYLFYDSYSSEIRKNFKELISIITFPDSHFTSYNDYGTIQRVIKEIYKEGIQLQCQLCSNCGNYMNSNNLFISDNALCFCHHNDNIFDDDFDIDLDFNIGFDDDIVDVDYY